MLIILRLGYTVTRSVANMRSTGILNKYTITPPIATRGTRYTTSIRSCFEENIVVEIIKVRYNNRKNMIPWLSRRNNERNQRQDMPTIMGAIPMIVLRRKSAF